MLPIDREKLETLLKPDDNHMPQVRKCKTESLVTHSPLKHHAVQDEASKCKGVNDAVAQESESLGNCHRLLTQFRSRQLLESFSGDNTQITALDDEMIQISARSIAQ